MGPPLLDPLGLSYNRAVLDQRLWTFLLDMTLVLLASKVFGALAARLEQPPVLGELLGGLVLGCGLFGFFDPHAPGLELLAGTGVTLLLFETGLESDFDGLRRAGPASMAVACVGVAVPFLLGWALMRLTGAGAAASVFMGAALTATSVGITARVLSDMGKLARPESQVILGAAVIDDILGLAILAAVQGTVSWSGTALTVGAFLAGLLLARTGRHGGVAETLKPVSGLLIPVFFVLAGAKVGLVRFHPLLPGAWLLYAFSAALVALAVAGKVASGWAARGGGLNRLAVGVGMIPRGEVGLIFAQIGLASGVIDEALYSALVAMVVATTFITPPLLKRVFAD